MSRDRRAISERTNVMRYHLFAPLLPIVFVLAGCESVPLADGTTLPPEDAIDQVVATLSPFAHLVPYGSAMVAALVTGTGLYRKYRPSIKALEEIVKNVETFPKTAKTSFKQHMTAITSAQTKKVISGIKSKGGAT